MQGLKLFILISVVVISLISCNDSNPKKGDKRDAPPNTTDVNSIVNDTILTVDVNIEPVWLDADGSTDSSELPKEFHLFWDLSTPMGGYIYDTNRSRQSTLSYIHSLVYESSESVYGSNGISLKCMNIDSPKKPIGCDIDLNDRKSFREPDSRIQNGIQFAIDGLKNGSIIGVAFVSDLMATTSGGRPIIGPTALRKHFRDSHLKAHFNEGSIHMAILGIRLDYWGVYHDYHCPKQAESDLGCWFHEGNQEWRRLDKVVNRPIYVIVMGRSGDRKDDNRDENPVNEIVREVEEFFDDRFDVRHETLTLGTLDDDQTKFTWNQPLEEYRVSQSIGFDPKRGYFCKMDDTFKLAAEFEESSISIDEGSVEEKIDSLGFFGGLRRHGKNGLMLELDCESVRDSIRQERRRKKGEEICNDDRKIKPVFSEVNATFSYRESGEHSWSAWSSPEERADSTLRLKNFINDLRPNHYEATISPFPPLSCERE